MAAYVFFDVKEVLDSDKLAEYRSLVLETVTHYGGRYLILGGKCERIEGNWQPAFPVLIQFESLDIARQWYDSEEYRYPKSLRLAGAKCDAVIMESEPNSFVKA